MPPDRPGLLCVVNFPANTGFAWKFIEGLYARVAQKGQELGWRTFVAYPRVDSPPRTLEGSPAIPVVLTRDAGSAGDLVRLWRFVRAERIRTVYLTDRPVRSWVHLLLRAGGVRRIVVHDHTSGERTPPRGLKRFAKRMQRLVPGLEADRVLTVSDYVARRQVEVGLVPPGHVTRVWNGIAAPVLRDVADVRQELGLPADRPIIVCCCRAAPEKGVQHLLRAFAGMQRTPGPQAALLVHVGDGPELDALRELATSLGIAADVRFTGYSNDVAGYLRAADVVAVPSVWQDALPLGVLEAMAAGRPVVATRVGGIPEMCRDGEEGLLVAPGAEDELGRALAELLGLPALRAAMGERGRQRVAAVFSPEAQLDAIVEQLDLRRTGPPAAR